jgi:hypothetical protein
MARDINLVRISKGPISYGVDLDNLQLLCEGTDGKLRIAATFTSEAQATLMDAWLVDLAQRFPVRKSWF